jgi:hypothetical protein
MKLGLLKNNFLTFLDVIFNLSTILKFGKFKNSYQNRRCFIIGTGPSLKIEDLEMLSNDITFASNSIFNLFHKTNWRPTFFCVSDRKYFFQNVTELNNLSGFIKFFPIDLKTQIQKLDKVFFYGRVFRIGKNYSFNRKPNFFIFDGSTVTFHMLQIAIYMGFKEIYLLGLDFNYSLMLNDKGEIVQNENIKDYFSDQSATRNLNIPDIGGSLENFQAIRKYADLTGIKVYNSTRGGKLEVFNRVNFDNIFNKDL